MKWRMIVVLNSESFITLFDSRNGERNVLRNASPSLMVFVAAENVPARNVVPI